MKQETHNLGKKTLTNTFSLSLTPYLIPPSLPFSYTHSLLLSLIISMLYFLFSTFSFPCCIILIHIYFFLTVSLFLFTLAPLFLSYHYIITLIITSSFPHFYTLTPFLIPSLILALTSLLSLSLPPLPTCCLLCPHPTAQCFLLVHANWLGPHYETLCSLTTAIFNVHIDDLLCFQECSSC